MSGYRSGFEPIRTPKAEFGSQEEATGAMGTCPEIGYDPQLASGEEAKVAARGGGINRYLTVSTSCGSNIVNVRVSADERVPLVKQLPRFHSGTPELEEGECRYVRDSTRGNGLSGRKVGESVGVDARGGEDQVEGRRTAFVRECLLPFRLLDRTRVRTVLFVFGVLSVRQVSRPLYAALRAA